MMKVNFAPGDPPRIGRVETYIDPFPFNGTVPIRDYDALDDGSILTSGTVEEITAYKEGRAARSVGEVNGLKEIRVVLNFVEEMRQRTGQQGSR